MALNISIFGIDWKIKSMAFKYKIHELNSVRYLKTSTIFFPLWECCSKTSKNKRIIEVFFWDVYHKNFLACFLCS